jgi:phosphatidylserine/phosphatidylglycerophosphate/cardiolipin synthase-like enzyme
MNRSQERWTIRALCLVIGAVLGFGVAAAIHGDKAHGDTPAFAPIAGTAFNNPSGTADEQYKIMNRLMDDINNAPKGSTIRVAIYSLDLPDFATSLINAHERGVYVKVLMDSHGAPNNALWAALQKELGKKVSTASASSFATLCTGGCITHHTSGPSYLHAKFYLFSGGGHPTVVVSSANPTVPQAETAWNNSFTTVGNQGLYNSYVSRFSLMSTTSVGKAKASAYGTYGTNPKSYYWPRGKGGSDTINSMFKLIKCPSTIRIAMFQWSDSRVALANTLVAMGKAGCTIKILYTADQIGPKIQAALKNKKNVTVTDTTTGNVDGYAEHYTHNKYALIDGTYDGKKAQQIVITGSENYTINALDYNDETDLKLTGTGYADYLDNWQDQFDAVTKTTTLKAKAEQRAEGDAPVIKIDPRQIDGRDAQ